MRKLGCFVSNTFGNSIEKNMELIKYVGFDSTFLQWNENAEFEKSISKAKELGLEVEALHSNTEKANSIWEVGDEGDCYTEELRRCIQTAGEYGVPYVIIHATNGVMVPKTSSIGLLRFKKLIVEAERRNVKLAFENVEYVRYVALLLEVFKNDNVGFCYDVGHEKCYTPGIKCMPLFGDRLFFTNIHDNDGLAATKDVNSRDDFHKLPFEGSVDFHKVCNDIKDSGYAGTVMLEVDNGEPYYFYDDLTAEEFYQKAYDAALKLRSMVDYK